MVGEDGGSAPVGSAASGGFGVDADGPVPAWLGDALVACGLVDRAGATAVCGRPLTGGVSSDIWVAHLLSGPVCVKRALARLRVAAVWEAPIERSASEAAWLARAQRIDADATPPLLGYDAATGAIVLGWLDPADHPQWKSQLMRGEIDPEAAVAVASALGARLARFHRGMSAAFDPSAAGDFDNGALFDALRLRPYLGPLADAHPSLAEPLAALRESFSSAAATVVHGDVSPKNVLVGPNGPVLLDAECACWGDPAFDVAFLLSHLLLKARHRPADEPALGAAAGGFWDAYRAGVVAGAGVAIDAVAGLGGDAAAEFEGRVASWWAALVLARIDGSSPVEYLAEPVRTALRLDVVALVARPPALLAGLNALWRSS